MSFTGSKIILALDFPNAEKALQLVEQLDPVDCKLKIGKELFTREGPALVRRLVSAGFDIFLDLKFHDIPNTTAKAVAAASDLGVWMVNIHSSGGRQMMQSAANQLQSMGSETLLTAVTVLTSLNDADLVEIGVVGGAEAQVQRLAMLAKESGVDGVVCSAHEAAAIATATGQEFLRVTPGIRPQNTSNDDQQRVMGPLEALQAGSSYLVVGRPVTRAMEPKNELLAILDEIREY